MIETSARETLASMLSELSSSRVETTSELASWYDRAHAVEEFARTQNCELPEQVWHYLSDADIRLKDPEYGQHQLHAVQEFVEQITREHGSD